MARIVVDGRPGLATPNFRMLMLTECAGLFFLCGLLFYGLTDHRFVRRGLLPQKLWWHALYCWVIRAAILVAFKWLSIW